MRISRGPLDACESEMAVISGVLRWNEEERGLFALQLPWSASFGYIGIIPQVLASIFQAQGLLVQNRAS